MTEQTKWDDSMRVGVKELDEQHKKLIEISNLCCSEFDKGSAKTTEEVLKELIEFTRIHFSTEEKYFEETNYVDKEEHMNEHANIIEKILDFKKRYDSGEDISKEFHKFVHEWINTHFKEEDIKYIKTFKEHGLK